LLSVSQHWEVGMVSQWLVAIVHLLALGIGLGAVWTRGRALLGVLDEHGIRRVLTADNWWAVAAFLWVASGLVRLFAGTDKGSAYYFANWLFWTKMVLFLVILLHEIRPIRTFMGWRRALAAGKAPDTTSARRLARVSFTQAVMVAAMVAAATGMARGFGAMDAGE
jgi:putative membrane protein